MVCACIDIGSNTTRVLVAEAAAGAAPRCCSGARSRASARVEAGAEIPRAKIEEVAGVVAPTPASPSRPARRAVRAVATAAIRGGVNRDEFVRSVGEPGGVRSRSSTGRRRRGWRSWAPRGRSRRPLTAASRWSTSAAARPRSRSARSTAGSTGGASFRVGSGFLADALPARSDPPTAPGAREAAPRRTRRTCSATRAFPAADARSRSAAAPPRCARLVGDGARPALAQARAATSSAAARAATSRPASRSTPSACG